MDRFVPWKDNLLRRILGFSPFELQEEVRRLRKLVEDLRREHAAEVEALRKRLGGPREAEPEAGGVVRLPVRSA
jgi:hypothetical protein